MAERIETLAEGVTLMPGDCLEELPELSPDAVDSCVTDPPYHLTMAKRLAGSNPNDVENNFTKTSPGQGVNPFHGQARGFMGKAWDGGDIAFRVELWQQVFRVLKPGAHLVAFGGTRTYHRMACAIEDAGFEIRDQLAWMYGSGFPKSLDVSKAIDKARRRDFVSIAIEMGVTLPGRSVDDWTQEDHAPGDKWWAVFKASLPPDLWATIERRVTGETVSGASAWFTPGVGTLTAPATDAARQWSGFGTALKPAWEPIVLARKPLIGTVAQNVLAHGTGALNIDGCRVGEGVRVTTGNGRRERGDGWGMNGGIIGGSDLGRWPANLVHDGSEEVLAGFPETQSTIGIKGGTSPNPMSWGGNRADANQVSGHGDSGSAARFFYTAKADADDRLGSKHPTVKPVDLMQWLVRLVTPPGGLVIDPFAGTGTTGEAAFREGMRAVLIEREAEYQADIRRRMSLLMSGQHERRHEALKASGKMQGYDDLPLFTS